MVAKNVDYKWYEYHDDQGLSHAIKVSTLIGEDADFGFGAAPTVAMPVITQRGRTKCRTIEWVDPNTGRTTRTPVGAPLADIITDPSGGYVGYGRDTTTDIVYAFYAFHGERIAKAHTIKSKPQPA